jgi:hypothetical protein
MALVGDRFQGLGQCGGGHFQLSLTPGSESTAQRVRATSGPSIQMMVGLTVWNGRPGRSPRCGSLPEPSATNHAYTSSLRLHSRRIKVGADLAGVVVVHNSGRSGVAGLPGSPVQVVITTSGTRRVVGIFSGAIGGTGGAGGLGPGQSRAISIVGGTARCDGGLGSALPPGRYDAVAEVSGIGVDGALAGAEMGIHFTQSVPIQIVSH